MIWKKRPIENEIATLNSKLINYKDVDITNVAVTTGNANNGYYSDDIPFTLPDGAVPISAVVFGAFDQCVDVALMNRALVLHSVHSKTISSTNRYVRVAYVKK